MLVKKYDGLLSVLLAMERHKSVSLADPSFMISYDPDSLQRSDRTEEPMQVIFVRIRSNSVDETNTTLSRLVSVVAGYAERC